MDAFFQACLESNREIYHHIKGGLSGTDRKKSTQGAGGDISSGIDLRAEAVFIKHLSSFGQMESEESGVLGSGEYRVVIDPLDGSSNILSNFPYYGSSVALVDPHGAATKAVVANLATGDIFFKKIGLAPLRGQIENDIFGEYTSNTRPEVGLFEKACSHPDTVAKLSDLHMKFRSPGAVALSLVYARNASFFLYMGMRRTYDFAAGLLFCEDLEVVVKDEYVIVSKDKATVNRIESVVALQRGD